MWIELINTSLYFEATIIKSLLEDKYKTLRFNIENNTVCVYADRFVDEVDYIAEIRSFAQGAAMAIEKLKIFSGIDM